MRIPDRRATLKGVPLVMIVRPNGGRNLQMRRNEFSALTPYFFQFTCTYCCVTSKCNSNIVPAANTLFQGSTSVTTSKQTTITTTTTSRPTPSHSTAKSRLTSVTTSKPKTTTTTSRPTSHSTVKSIECEVCHGGLCGLIPGNDPKQTCPSSKPYCMNTVQNENTGQNIYTKICATDHECQVKWWEESSDETKCTDFSPLTPYFFQFTCSYCCVTPSCNSDIFHASSTLYKGKG